MRTCILCGDEMPEGWQKLSDEDVTCLARPLAIHPVCQECFKKGLFRQFGVKPKSAENKA